MNHITKFLRDYTHATVTVSMVVSTVAVFVTLTWWHLGGVGS